MIARVTSWTYSFICLALFVLFLPKDWVERGQALKLWNERLAMIDREVMLYALVGALIARLLWIDVRPHFDRVLVRPKRARRMAELAGEIRTFGLNHQLNQPGAGDNLNYVSPALRGVVDVRGTGNVVTNGDAADARVFAMTFEERRNYELTQWNEFHSRFAARVSECLTYVEEAGLIQEGPERDMVTALRAHRPYGNTTTIYSRISDTIGVFASRYTAAP